MPTFAQIQEEINNMLEVPDEELDEEQKALMDQYLNELASQEAKKVDAFAQFIKLETERVETIKAESTRLSERADAVKKGISRLKKYYINVMRANGLKKVNGEIYSLSVRKSEKVDTPDSSEGIAALPEIYQRIKTSIEPDKTAIKEALKGGLSVPGCSIQESYSLQIR